MAVQKLDWSSGVVSDYCSNITYDGSSVNPTGAITTDRVRFAGGKSFRISMPKQNGTLGRLYAWMRTPDIPAGGGGMEKWYFRSFYLGDDFKMNEVVGGNEYFLSMGGWRYHGGGIHNGPYVATINGSAAPELASGAYTEASTGAYITGSYKTYANRLVKNAWIDVLIHAKWTQYGTSAASQGFYEQWVKFDSETWDQATHSLYTGGTIRYGTADFQTAAQAPSYMYIALYQGHSVSAARTMWHGPVAIGDTRAEVDLTGGSVVDPGGGDTGGGGTPTNTDIDTLSSTDFSDFKTIVGQVQIT